MRRRVYAERKSAYDSGRPSLNACANSVALFMPCTVALRLPTMASAEWFKRSSRPFTYKTGGGSTDCKEELRIIAVAECDDVVRAVGEPCERVLRAFGIAAADNRTCNIVRYKPTYFSVACAHHLLGRPVFREQFT